MKQGTAVTVGLFLAMILIKFAMGHRRVLSRTISTTARASAP